LNLPQSARKYLLPVTVAAMSAYRIYELTAEDHVACAPTIVDCLDDAAAIEKARQLVNGRIIEVWLLDRCVVRIKPNKLS
jgi:hypothetical protein